MKIYSNLTALIGSTPLLEAQRLTNVKNLNAKILLKLEALNPGGSVKDRVALAMIEDAEKKGLLTPGGTIIEATSGNTGIALAALGRYYKYPVYIFMPDWVSKERINLIKNYGANIILFSKEEGGFIRCVSEAKKMAKEKNGFLANQFANEDNFKAHFETTAEEIWKYMPKTKEQNAESVMLTDYPSTNAQYENEELSKQYT